MTKRPPFLGLTEEEIGYMHIEGTTNAEGRDKQLLLVEGRIWAANIFVSEVTDDGTPFVGHAFFEVESFSYWSASSSATTVEFTIRAIYGRDWHQSCVVRPYSREGMKYAGYILWSRNAPFPWPGP